MTEEINPTVEVAKERGKTDQFKEHVQKIVYQVLGVKVSKEKAWELFKSTIHGTVEFVLNLNPENSEEGRKLSLSGVGTFQILETKPRGSKAGLDEDGNPIEGAEVWPCVPRFRFYPSSTVDKLCEYKYGLGGHEIEEKHYGIFAPVIEVSKPAKPKPETKKAGKSNKPEKAEPLFEDEI